MEPLISLVVVNLDNAEGLRTTLSSIVRQSTNADLASLYDVCVIDGLSADDSIAVAKEFGERYAQVRFVSESDEGVYDAMNKGIRHTDGEYIIFMNSGDRFGVDTALASIASKLASRPAWLVVGAINLGGGVRPPSVIRNLPHSWFRHLIGVQPHCHQACVFRRDLVTALGGYHFDYGIIGDFDFIVRCGAVSRPLEHNDLLVEYEGGGMSERAWRSIPELQHQVRLDILDNRGPLALFSRWWARYLIFRRDLARRKNRTLEILKHLKIRLRY